MAVVQSHIPSAVLCASWMFSQSRFFLKFHITSRCHMNLNIHATERAMVDSSCKAASLCGLSLYVLWLAVSNFITKPN